MYDTVSFYTERGKEDADYIINKLHKPKEEINMETGEILSAKGTYKNLYVKITPNQICISGSLAKFQNGNNIDMFSRLQTKDVIEHMSDIFLIDMGKANISRLDFSATIQVNNPTIEYLSIFGRCGNLSKIIYPTTVYYQSDTKATSKPLQLCIYDKIAEAFSDGKIPLEYKDINLLRYELKLRRSLANRFGVVQVLGNTLFDPCFYAKMMNIWTEYYYKIEKYNVMKPNFIDNIESPDDAWNVYVASLITNADRGEFDAYLRGLKTNKVFSRRGDYTRLKSKFDKINSNESCTNSQDLTNELDGKIQDIKNNWS